MKRLFTLALFVVAVTTAFAQPQLIRVLNQNNFTTAGWLDTSDYNYTYNSAGLVETVDFNVLDVPPKKPQYLDSNYYNTSNQLTFSKTFSWNSSTSTWNTNPYGIIEYTYNGSLLEKFKTTYTNIGRVDIDSFIYNSSGKVEYEYDCTINNGIKSCSFRYKNVYNSSGDIIEKTFQKHLGGSWNDDYRTTYTYNSSNELVEELKETYNGSLSTWSNNSKVEITYSGGKVVSRKRSYYNSGTWTLLEDFKYFYNPNGTLKEAYFTPVSRALYFYDPATTGINNVMADDIAVYPNPSNGRFTIDVANVTSTIVVTDVAGKQVYTGNATGSLTVDLSHLQKGVYLVNITNESGSSTQKIVLQ